MLKELEEHKLKLLQLVQYLKFQFVSVNQVASSSSDDCDKYVWNVIKPLKYSRIKLPDLPELDEDIFTKGRPFRTLLL